MIYVNAFILCGFICAVGQLIIEFTNLTPGHVNALFVVIGAFLSFIGIYEPLLSWAKAGASIPITNFGHLLFKGAYEGYLKDGITGLLNGIMSTSSGGLSVTIIIAFLIGMISKPKN